MDTDATYTDEDDEDNDGNSSDSSFRPSTKTNMSSKFIY